MSQEICIKVLLLCSRVFLKTCGIALMAVFFILGSWLIYIYFNQIMPFYRDTGHSIVYFTGIISLLVFGLNMLFNYISAALVSPGFTEEYREMIDSIEGHGSFEKCGMCNIGKPNNVHHCSTCNKCVINLDHHCPWINNCVGFYNLRYFLLFLLYTCLSCITFTVMALPILFDKYSINSMPVELFTATLTCAGVGFTLLFFSIWAWYLGISNQRFVEILRRRGTEDGFVRQGFTWSESCIRGRLFQIFGTSSCFKVLLPSRRRLLANPFENYYSETVNISIQ